MTHCASSGVLLVWIMAQLHHQTSAIHTQLCHALWNQTKKHNTIPQFDKSKIILGIEMEAAGVDVKIMEQIVEL